MTSLQKRQGFSLMETVIALGVVALLLTSFLSVFGPAANNIRKAISAQEAERLASALEAELNTRRDGENHSDGSAYTSAFDKAFDYINGSDAPGEFLVLYNYRADSTAGAGAIPDSGIIPSYTGNKIADPDQEVIIQSAVRRLDYGNLQNELNNVEGPVFIARLTQLVYDQNGALKPVFVANEDGSAGNTGISVIGTGDPGLIYDPTFSATRATITDSDLYLDSAAIAFQAKFYLLSSNSFAYIADPANPDRLSNKNLEDLQASTGKPIFTRNMAVRR